MLVARQGLYGARAGLADKRAFKKFLVPLRRIKWVVYCKDPAVSRRAKTPPP
jgi:ribosomal protein L37AE/L43A